MHNTKQLNEDERFLSRLLNVFAGYNARLPRMLQNDAAGGSGPNERVAALVRDAGKIKEWRKEAEPRLRFTARMNIALNMREELSTFVLDLSQMLHAQSMALVFMGEDRRALSYCAYDAAMPVPLPVPDGAIEMLALTDRECDANAETTLARKKDVAALCRRHGLTCTASILFIEETYLHAIRY